MKPGKLPLDFLAQLLSTLHIEDKRVALGPRPGEDAALIDFGDRYLVAKTDPITFATDHIGWYAVQVNANDIAVMGGTPKWMMTTLLLPESVTRKQVAAMFAQLQDAAAKLNITLVGGHTEITYELPRPMAVGVMLGEVEKDKVVLTSGAKPGDALMLTKGIALEGTSILAREAAPALRKAGVKASAIRRAKDFLFDPGISVVKDAAVACAAVPVHAMHDPTEGGLASGLLEMAQAGGVGLVLDAEAIPLLSECEEFCCALGIDPLGLIASGALLAAVARQDVPKLKLAMDEEGIGVYEIGRVTEVAEGLRMRKNGRLQRLPRFARDELVRYLGG
ncbi:MAG: AIR synthase family protein [Chloroflexi bacterium]|nr:AIR synthase family protein [Chloroflexota bacterium]